MLLLPDTRTGCRCKPDFEKKQKNILSRSGLEAGCTSRAGAESRCVARDVWWHASRTGARSPKRIPLSAGSWGVAKRRRGRRKHYVAVKQSFKSVARGSDGALACRSLNYPEELRGTTKAKGRKFPLPRHTRSTAAQGASS